jgi:hypothetical protein
MRLRPPGDCIEPLDPFASLLVDQTLGAPSFPIHEGGCRTFVVE